MKATELRYRERPIKQDKSFYGNANGKLMTSTDILGKSTSFNQFGGIRQVQNVFAVQSDPSISREQTWDAKHPGPPYNVGGPFFSLKRTVPTAMVVNVSLEGIDEFGRRKTYSGGIQPQLTTVGPTYSQLKSNSPDPMTFFPSVASYHDKAWDLLRPKLERASMSQFLIELRDLPGMLRITAGGFKELYKHAGGHVDKPYLYPKKVAEHFLNHQFGWLPFVNDIIKFIDVYENSKAYVERIVSSNGRWRRRHVEVDNTHTVQLLRKDYAPAIWPAPTLIPNLPFGGFFVSTTVDGQNCLGITETFVEITQRVWADGSFTYYRPEFDKFDPGFDSQVSKLKRLLILYGARINPEVLWKVTPWTWLVDWLVGIGRNVALATTWAEDQIAARYAYIMVHRIEDYLQKITVFTRNGPQTYTLLRTVEYKERVDAGSPYGFSLTWDQLTPRQLAILGAIGLTRL